MLVTLGLWVYGLGIVALKFECLGAALVLFGIAGEFLAQLCRHVRQRGRTKKV